MLLLFHSVVWSLHARQSTIVNHMWSSVYTIPRRASFCARCRLERVNFLTSTRTIRKCSLHDGLPQNYSLWRLDTISSVFLRLKTILQSVIYDKRGRFLFSRVWEEYKSTEVEIFDDEIKNNISYNSHLCFMDCFESCQSLKANA